MSFENFECNESSLIMIYLARNKNKVQERGQLNISRLRYSPLQIWEEKLTTYTFRMDIRALQYENAALKIDVASPHQDNADLSNDVAVLKSLRSSYH
jgi:hypothetical protein